MSTEPEPKPLPPENPGATQPPVPPPKTAAPRPGAAPGKAAAPLRRYTPPKDNSKRDTIIIVSVGLILFAFLIVGFLTMSKRGPSANMLTGTVTAKHYTGERTEEVVVSRKGVQRAETDSGYSLTVKVEPDGREYELPVSKELYDAKKVGDKQDFIRPPDEQTF